MDQYSGVCVTSQAVQRHYLLLIRSQVVHPFYATWQSYCTKLTYVWVDKYDVHEAPDRRVARLIEKENKKERDKERKKRNELIRVSWSVARNSLLHQVSLKANMYSKNFLAFPCVTFLNLLSSVWFSNQIILMCCWLFVVVLFREIHPQRFGHSNRLIALIEASLCEAASSSSAPTIAALSRLIQNSCSRVTAYTFCFDCVVNRYATKLIWYVHFCLNPSHWKNRCAHWAGYQSEVFLMEASNARSHQRFPEPHCSTSAPIQKFFTPNPVSSEISDPAPCAHAHALLWLSCHVLLSHWHLLPSQDLVRFVRKRDPRVRAHREELEEVALKNAAKAAEKRAQLLRFV